MSLDKRIERLEQASAHKRCRVCKDLPELRVHYSGGEPPLTNGMKRSDPFEGKLIPCPTCGWRPMEVTVEYVEMPAQSKAEQES